MEHTIYHVGWHFCQSPKAGGGGGGGGGVRSFLN